MGSVITLLFVGFTKEYSREGEGGEQDNRVGIDSSEIWVIRLIRSGLREEISITTFSHDSPKGDSSKICSSLLKLH